MKQNYDQIKDRPLPENKLTRRSFIGGAFGLSVAGPAFLKGIVY